MEKLIAFCTECGATQGIFNKIDDLRLAIAKIKKCESCGVEFKFLTDGRIWNIRWGKADSDTEESFWDDIHKSIIKISRKKFEDKHYSDAVETACKDVNGRVQTIVKNITGIEMDGASLMSHAFSVKKPIISLDDLSTQIGKDIQQGYMQLFMGTMIGIRNPKAHKNINIDRRRAVHFMFLTSLLMEKLDEAGFP